MDLRIFWGVYIGLKYLIIIRNAAVLYLLKNPVRSNQSKYPKKVQEGKDQEKAQAEQDSHSKNRGGKKNKLTIRHLYHENIS